MPRIAWHIPVAFALLISLFLLARQHAPSGTINAWFSSSRTRLNQTLAGNEMRYQAAVKERKDWIARIGGGDVPSFSNPNDGGWSYTLWDFFVPAFSCPFPVVRVGTLGDGGKFVCGFERAVAQPGCVVYSMGVERQSTFEQAILHQSDHCQVYGFDYSVSQWGPDLLEDTAVNPHAHFFPYKIGGTDNHDSDPKEYTLAGIMKELGHTFIDIWKIDIEGSEFPALRDVIRSFDGQPLPFGQMEIEIHIGEGMQTIGLFDDWWTMLEDAGLRPFWNELNAVHVNGFRAGPTVIEWSFINIRGKHALTDDTLPDYP
ncbi:methyltransferase domain-containing protein [Mycena sanguinolenta]|nr:methyltransferase domain-containing protein [Mycena sanguinolenta]